MNIPPSASQTAQRAGDAAEPAKRILLVEPFLHVHSFTHYRAAAVSEGFESAQIVVLTSTVNEAHRAQAEQFAREHGRFEFRWLETRTAQIRGRLHGWQLYRRAMLEAEALLRAEAFDRVAYVMADLTLPFLGLPLFRSQFAAHRRLGVSGILFRDQGLRPSSRTVKARLLAGLDRFLLGCAARSGAFHRLTFFDHLCADRARGRWGALFGPGVDPMELKTADPAEARRKFALAPQDTVLLLFGAMSDRKGVAESLAGICAAGLDAERTVVVLAGPVEPSYRPVYDGAIEAASQRLRILRHDRFVDEADIPFYFAAADVVLCVYKNFNASSGVLLHAASMGKAVLVCKNGVMEDAVARFGFGRAVDAGDTAGIAGALKDLLGLPQAARAEVAAGARRYAESMDARRYLAQFFQNAPGPSAS